ncbi:lipid A deacylase LpxR family protein [Photobacterium lipolyticum]|uniref:DUF2219 domain-containing protein n=1 Tax=Photobacterium lipolyticum TaxID=266810 RepID=A0A2T3MZW8_9GAMM|nr:lipid A deacylase LpxR family protein [Photobacterium lipolyticum]PSW05492.1 DUF2219 domain-containing protein [Photobacterium lipolyticum]
MKQIYLGILTISSLFSPAVMAYNSGSLSFAIDNDGIVTTDQNYTNGLFLEFNSAASNMIESDAPSPIRQIARLLPLDSAISQGWNLQIGQQIWTPEDIEATEPVPDEHPYAGLLFFATGIYQYSPARVDKYSFMLGTVGPNALAEEGQRFIHAIIGSDEPMGWDFQIRNQVVFNIGYQGHHLLNREQAGLMEQYDVSGVGRINIGNYQSEAALGAVGRWGSNLIANFGSVGFTPGKFFDVSVLSTSASGYHLFTGIEGRYRFNDITVEGDRPDEVPDTHIEHLQATAVAGFVYYQPKWGLSLSLATGTREFKEDKHSTHSNGSFEIFWRL